jgi:exodeoxyribonuclease V alpha subunit
MNDTLDIHEQFGRAFGRPELEPYAAALSRKLSEGHICLQTEIRDLNRLRPFVTDDPGVPAPFVYHDSRLYMQRYFSYETQVLRLIREKVEAGRPKEAERRALLEHHRDLITGLAAGYSLAGLTEDERVDWQLIATLRAMLSDLFILVGGPGMGKTRTLSLLLQVIFATDPEARVALAAPTGKAAMRMHESLLQTTESLSGPVRAAIESLRPSTLHSLLGYRKDSVYFRHNESNRLAYDWVMVDETSMVDLPMMAKLLAALGERTRIVLIGDQNQLSSVEAGSLLGDLCKTVPVFNRVPYETAEWINGFIPDPERRMGDDHVAQQDSLIGSVSVQLKLSHRFKAQGMIGNLSKAIIESRTDEIERLLGGDPDPSLVFDEAYDPAVLEEVAIGYADFIREPDIATALKKLNSLRVLVAVREGDKGLYAVNRKIEAILQQRRLIHPNKAFYAHRPVMVTRNNYELGLFNGDVGIIRPDAEGEMRAWFEDPETGVRPVNPAYLNEVETVWCMTIHKSQGSEFNTAMLILPEGTENRLLTRELLYTGVTRAKTKVVIQGSMETLLHAASQTVKRESGIAARLDHKKGED